MLFTATSPQSCHLVAVSVIHEIHSMLGKHTKFSTKAFNCGEGAYIWVPGPGSNGGCLVGAWDQDDEGFREFRGGERMVLSG